MAKYELSDQVVRNLGVFLDKVPIQGHQARMAMNEVCDALSRPISEEKAGADIKEMAKQMERREREIIVPSNPCSIATI